MICKKTKQNEVVLLKQVSTEKKLLIHHHSHKIHKNHVAHSNTSTDHKKDNTLISKNHLYELLKQFTAQYKKQASDNIIASIIQNKDISANSQLRKRIIQQTIYLKKLFIYTPKDYSGDNYDLKEYSAGLSPFASHCLVLLNKVCELDPSTFQEEIIEIIKKRSQD